MLEEHCIVLYGVLALRRAMDFSKSDCGVSEWISYFILIINDRVFSNLYIQGLPRRGSLLTVTKVATYYEGAV